MALPAQSERPQGEITTLLGRGSEFEGKLTFEGTVRIDGKLSGEIFSEDVLVVGEGAMVNAEIDVGVIIVEGNVTGNIRAKRAVELHARARVKVYLRHHNATATDLERVEVVARNVMTGTERTIETVSLFAYASPRVSNDGLRKALRAQDITTHVIGDAAMPRSALITLQEAHALGNTLFTPSFNGPTRKEK